MKTNQEYKNAALAALKGNWPQALVTTIIYVLVIVAFSTPYLYGYMNALNGKVVSATLGAVSYILFVFGAFFLCAPMNVGYAYSLHQLQSAGDDRVIGNTFRTAFRSYFRNVWGMFLMGLFINLWTMLLIIPGLVKVYSYALTPYILVDYPELSANQAINLSRKMMKGHKFDLFYLHLSFIGWGILSIFTLGVGLLWLMPYMSTSQAAFYQKVKAGFMSETVS